MSIRRIITDIPQADVPFVAAMVAADGGRIVEQTAESDGEVTIVAEFPEPAEEPAGDAQAGATTPSAAVPQAADWMRVARAELGEAELPGAASNPRIETYHGTTSGGAADDSVPWCASFVNFCIREAGGKGTNSKAARSWMTWGRDAGAFVDGCVVVLRRGAAPKGHVGFFVGLDGDRIQLLGGNQGNAVSVASFERSRVLARRLAA